MQHFLGEPLLFFFFFCGAYFLEGHLMPANRYELARFLVSWYDCSPHHHLLLGLTASQHVCEATCQSIPSARVRRCSFFLQPKIIHNDRNWNTDSFVTQRCRSRASNKKKGKDALKSIFNHKTLNLKAIYDKIQKKLSNHDINNAFFTVFN